MIMTHEYLSLISTCDVMPTCDRVLFGCLSMFHTHSSGTSVCVTTMLGCRGISLILLTSPGHEMQPANICTHTKHAHTHARTHARTQHTHTHGHTCSHVSGHTHIYTDTRTPRHTDARTPHTRTHMGVHAAICPDTHVHTWGYMQSCVKTNTRTHPTSI